MKVFSRQRCVALASMQDALFAPEHRPSCGGVNRRRHFGFTILELMVAVAVAGVLLIIAVPSFRQLTLSSRLTTAANDVVAAINVARMEAVKRNASSQFCSDLAANNQTDTLGTACSAQVQPGAVYGTSAAGAAASVLGGVSSIAMPLQLSGNVTALRFTSQGVGQQAGTTGPYGGPVAVICSSPLGSSFMNIRTITMTSGSILQVTQSAGACP